MYKVKNWWKYK